MNDPTPGATKPPIDLLDGIGESCATFTPLVAARMRELRPGERLEVVSDDATAPDALGSWARLTGNEVVETHDEGAGRYRFVLMRC